MSGYSFPKELATDKTREKYLFSSPTVPIPDVDAPGLRTAINKIAEKSTELIQLTLKLTAVALGNNNLDVNVCKVLLLLCSQVWKSTI